MSGTNLLMVFLAAAVGLYGLFLFLFRDRLRLQERLEEAVSYGGQLQGGQKEKGKKEQVEKKQNGLLARSQERKRRYRLAKEIPFTLDLITASVEAGLSFEGAMAKVVESIPGELGEEFGKTLKEIKMGIDRKTALKNMAARCEVKDLSTFVTSLIQADTLGVSLGNVLRIESAQIRERRKQAAREKAMQAPIKMLFPLILFIFPSIFVVILGPAVINIMNTLMNQ
ncbi:type II secretion system F family protein [Anaerotalea alkaliphila]|uniref:Type II secretion system F family protein n=1 Tax=Anaerotalea alkaliphila TaxID=2662126 RepID=A0A7X5HVC8_9FIRM|nr:type II secretion system F family protein [Anaerotalea alkaliphila]NDL67330.1 type II secretion system F family protein [Anaerotalea alkaliphila]